jgi:hypothetical protein
MAAATRQMLDLEATSQQSHGLTKLEMKVFDSTN